MIKKHKLVSNNIEYELSFGCYEIMMAARKFGYENLLSTPTAELTLELIKHSLSDFGEKEIKDKEVFQLIDGIGGITSNKFIEIQKWVLEALSTPEEEESKKKEEVIEG